MMGVADWRGPSLSHGLRVCRNDIIIGDAAAAGVVVGQQAGRGQDARPGTGFQIVSMHGWQLGFAATATGVFQGERTGVQRQRVELQRAGDSAGLEGRLDRQAGLLAASHRASFRLRVEVRTFVAPLLI